MSERTISIPAWAIVTILLFILASFGCYAQVTSGGASEAGTGPLTVAEASNYTATAYHAEVMEFIRKVQLLSPLMRVETLCRSAEGRDVPLLVLGNPAPANPTDVKHTGRSVVYIQANIHAGEVEGKEASLMLIRDILQRRTKPYLDRLVLLIVPIFNADGNDKISPKNRSYQPGPEKGVGLRANGQNLDLNRDAMKLESIEVNAMVQDILVRWDPLMLIDCHTTDGAYHQPTVTYAWPLNPNGDKKLIEYQRGRLLPKVQKIMDSDYHTLGLFYGEYRDPRKPELGWETLEAQPRFITNYVGLRNRFGILDENYVHADYRTRVQGAYAFLRAILDYTYDHADEMKTLVDEADQRTVKRGLAPTPTDSLAVEFELKTLPDPVTILGFEMEVDQKDSSRFPSMKVTDRKRTYKVPYYADWVAKRNVAFPYAYLLPGNESAAARKLREHGILVERLVEPLSEEVQMFRVKELKAAERLYQAHRLNTVKGEYAVERRDFPAGTFVVMTAQPLGSLAAYLLEPESDDGLFVWNYFDRDLVMEWDRAYQTYPVAKLLKPLNLVKETVE
jgi:dipeptidyl-peptidase-4